MRQDGYAALAVEYARRVESDLKPQTPPREQIDALELLALALRRADQNDEARRVDGRIAALEEGLDREYIATLPPVKQPIAGRKSKTDRAVLVEQFTTAVDMQCAGTDKACAMLLSTYKPSELVLLEYHVGNLRTDPMENPDAEARLAYYKKAFPIEVRTPPTSLINGHPTGRISDSDPKGPYEKFRGIIEPLLEENAGVTLTGKAVRSGDKIAITVNVAGLANPGTDKKLRIVLVEETVRFVGQNRVRLHHNVVRAPAPAASPAPRFPRPPPHTPWRSASASPRSAQKASRQSAHIRANVPVSDVDRDARSRCGSRAFAGDRVGPG